MDDAAFEVQKARVREAFDRWISLLRLQAWKLIFEWERGRGREGVVGSVIMEVKPDWRYLHARVIVWLGEVEGESDDELEETVVHELVHIHLNEIRVDDDSGEYAAHEERVTTQIARAFLGVRNHVRTPADEAGVPAGVDEIASESLVRQGVNGVMA